MKSLLTILMLCPLFCWAKIDSTLCIKTKEYKYVDRSGNLHEKKNGFELCYNAGDIKIKTGDGTLEHFNSGLVGEEYNEDGYLVLTFFSMPVGGYGRGDYLIEVTHSSPAKIRINYTVQGGKAWFAETYDIPEIQIDIDSFNHTQDSIARVDSLKNTYYPAETDINIQEYISKNMKFTPEEIAAKNLGEVTGIIHLRSNGRVYGFELISLKDYPLEYSGNFVRRLKYLLMDMPDWRPAHNFFGDRYESSPRITDMKIIAENNKNSQPEQPQKTASPDPRRFNPFYRRR